MDKRFRGVVPVVWGMLMACILLAACASQEKRTKADLEQLTQWLPGIYDNTAQAQADEQKGVRPAHDAIMLAIVPIYVPTIGDNVFYVQEMAADDPRRVMGQRLLSFEAAGGGIVQSVLNLSQPLRWRDGHLNPDLFKSMTPDDVTAVHGCEVLWKKTAERFEGTNDPQHCRRSSSSSRGSIRLESRVELGPEDLAMGDLGVDATGKLVQGRRDDPFYRFRKQGQ